MWRLLYRLQAEFSRIINPRLHACHEGGAVHGCGICVLPESFVQSRAFDAEETEKKATGESLSSDLLAVLDRGRLHADPGVLSLSMAMHPGPMGGLVIAVHARQAA